MIQSALWWLFLLCGPPIYWLLPERIRMTVLAMASLALVAVFAAADLLVMGALDREGKAFPAPRGRDRP